ncbi:MAG TPA: tetratricopeptide repeat-containing protein [Pyrinomonadaceae bacterium]
MRAFIVRPFGIKNDINFDEVERVLIDPVLTRLGVTGRTTGEIISQGNIREDMFRLLLTADLVVADLSIHNANAFYELGVRHALRDRYTFLLRSNVDKFPFDLQTDRYFTYNKDAPGDSVEALYRALRDTIDSDKPNSPVFALLPRMKEQDRANFMVVPRGFVEEVERAAAGRQLGDLRLLGAEARNLGFEWETQGLRAVGRAQYNLKDWMGAKNTWEAVRRNDREYDLEANILLGTIYEKLDKLTDSTQALDRALTVKEIPSYKRAEVYALKGRNAKSLWREEWEAVPDAAAKATTALRSAHLQDAFEDYQRAYEEDLNHFYSGLNALAMLKVRTELAAALPDVWGERFDEDEEAEKELTRLRKHVEKLAAYVELALDATMARLKHEGRKDVWAEVSLADLRLLTSNRPQKVAAAYRDALSGAQDLVVSSVSSQLVIYKELGVLSANVNEALKLTGMPKPAEEGARERERVLIFTGHMIDAEGRAKPRFPADKEDAARQKIREAVEAEMESGSGVAFGIAGGANGGDILFHEVCEELGVPTHLYLGLDPSLYVNASVRKAGADWVERFWRLHARLEAQGAVRLLCELTEEPADKSEYLPAWVRSKSDYNIWARTNLWMLHNALAAGGDDCVTLIALWDKAPTGDGPGGTSDLVARVERRGAKTVIIDTKSAFGL